MLLQLKPSKVLETEKTKLKNPARVRDHLANERTYLAWMRTAIALLSFGVVIIRLRIFQPPLTPPPGTGWKLGLVFSLLGLVTVFICTRHYFGVRWAIDQDTYEPADALVLLFSLAVTLLAVGVIYFVFTAPLSQVGFSMLE